MINVNNYNQAIKLTKTQNNRQITRDYSMSPVNQSNTNSQNITAFSGKPNLNIKSIKSGLAKLNLEFPYSPINIRRYYVKRDVNTIGQIKESKLLNNPVVKGIFDFVETKLKNYRTTSENVLRGGLVTCEYDIKRLKQKGVTDIVSFYHEAPPEKLIQCAKEKGMTYHHIPLNEKKPPSKEQVNEFFAIYEKLNGKMYGHCYHGKDRTGTMMFLLEVEKLGETPEKALDNMINSGHNFIKYPAHLEFLAEKYPSIKNYTDLLLKK